MPRFETHAQQQAAVSTIRAGLEAADWVCQHTWSDGYSTHLIFQEYTGIRTCGGKVRNMVIACDGHQNGYRVSLYQVADGNDYAGAKAVRMNECFKPVGERSISSCCTCGSEVLSNGFEDAKLCSVVGHGEWLVEVKRVRRPEINQ